MQCVKLLKRGVTLHKYDGDKFKIPIFQLSGKIIFEISIVSENYDMFIVTIFYMRCNIK